MTNYVQKMSGDQQHVSFFAVDEFEFPQQQPSMRKAYDVPVSLKSQHDPQCHDEHHSDSAGSPGCSTYTESNITLAKLSFPAALRVSYWKLKHRCHYHQTVITITVFGLFILIIYDDTDLGPISSFELSRIISLHIAYVSSQFCRNQTYLMCSYSSHYWVNIKKSYCNLPLILYVYMYIYIYMYMYICICICDPTNQQIHTDPYLCGTAGPNETLPDSIAMIRVRYFYRFIDRSVKHHRYELAILVHMDCIIQLSVTNVIYHNLGPDSIERYLIGIGNRIVEIRRSLDRPISTMGFLMAFVIYVKVLPKQSPSCQEYYLLHQSSIILAGWCLKLPASRRFFNHLFRQTAMKSCVIIWSHLILVKA